MINGNQAINMLKKGENVLKFNNFHKQLPVPFVIYADFEPITKKVQGCKQSDEMEKEKEKRSYTEAYQTHEDCGCGYKVVVAMMTNIANQSKRIEVRTPSINLWKRCSKRSNTAKLSLRKCLTLRFPSLLVPTPFTKGGSSLPPPTISKTIAPMNLKFCRVLETPFKVLEMLKLFT